jgi:hypothetical protein
VTRKFIIVFTTALAARLIRVRFEVLMAVTMKNGVPWDVTSCGACNYRRFAK